MASATEAICLSVLLFSLQLFFPLVLTTPTPTPTPTPWPHQFHSLQIWNTSGSLQINNLWYDWPKGRNMNLVQYQLGKLLYNLEWNNGTSFYYTLHPINHYCHVRHFDIGILRPNFLHDANYLGQQYVDNFLCNVWEKVDFIWYYEDVLTRLPVRWIFYTGMIVDVITFEAGVVLEDEHWQAPVYCFTEEDETQNSSGNPLSLSLESMREIAHPAYAK